MNRISSFLNTNEQISKKISPDFLKLFLSSKFTIGGIVLTIALIVAKITLNFNLIFLLIPLIFLLIGTVPAFITHFFTTYYITTEKVIIEKGIIGRDYDIVKLDKVLDVNLDSNFIDVIFGTGSIKLSNANENEAMILSNIRNPKSIIKLIQF